MQAALAHDKNVANDFAGREAQIDELEDEIIKNYSNSPDLKISKVADAIKIQEVLAASGNMLGRITEIHNVALKNLSKLKAIQQTLMDGILPLVTGGSADVRDAKARGCMQTINYYISLEEGLISICESTQKNIKNSQDMASRQLTVIQIDIEHFDGKDALKKIAEASKKLQQEAMRENYAERIRQI